MRKCVESLLCGGERIEIIIINDGSTDETRDIAAEYEEKYPNLIRVINQENQGHGGGINSGIAAATGKYFKMVDSDDRLDERSLIKTLDVLECEDVDMLVANYRYVHEDNRGDKSIRYGRALPKNRVIGWDETRIFGASQYLSIHSVIFKTETIRASGVRLPHHVFYEDNVFIYTVLPKVEKMIYLDLDLYHYTIGREGQSVQQNIIVSRYRHQMLASKTVFMTYHLADIHNTKLRRYMYHECVMMLALATTFARLNRTEEAERDVDKMWQECEAFDEKCARRIRKRSLAALVNLKGQVGREIAIVLYHITHKIIRFN